MNLLSRRRFVAVTSVAATSAVLVACGNEQLSNEELNPTQIPDVPDAPPTIAPLTSTPGAATGDEGGEADAGGDANVVEIQALDTLKFDPAEVDVAPGQTVRLTNAGIMQHDLYVQDWDLGTELLNGGEQGEIVVPEDAEIGATFEFHCTVPGHQQAGMTGTFTIVEASAAAPAEEAPAEEEPAAGGAGDAVEVTALDTLKFDPAEIEAAPGQTIRLTNDGIMQHDLYVQDWDLGTELLNSGEQGEIVVPEDAEVGGVGEG